VYLLPYEYRLSAPLRYRKTDRLLQPSAQQSAISDHLGRLALHLTADFMQVEVALSYGQPYVTGIMFSAMDADYNLVGKQPFEWIVKNLAQMMINKVLRRKHFGEAKDLSS
jgi:hypothetical protein